MDLIIANLFQKIKVFNNKLISNGLRSLMKLEIDSFTFYDDNVLEYFINKLLAPENIWLRNLWNKKYLMMIANPEYVYKAFEVQEKGLFVFRVSTKEKYFVVSVFILNDVSGNNNSDLILRDFLIEMDSGIDFIIDLFERKQWVSYPTVYSDIEENKQLKKSSKQEFLNVLKGY